MSFKTFFESLCHWFGSAKGQAVIKAIENAAIAAEPIVETIAALVPATNRTFAAVNAAYRQYAVPFAMTESQLTDPAQQGLALRDLATTVLRKNHQDASANVLNAAVELAVAHVGSR